tara:strand:+ start:1434 stop:2255 length:822 start_codon:yes stop_codon:yes gene_type:complete
MQDFHWSKRPSSASHFDFGVWANFVPHEGGYVGACRNGSMGLNDKIQILKFDSDINIVSSYDITKGEDPRSFIYNGEPHILTWDPSPNPAGGGNVFYYKVINAISGKVTTLSIENVPVTKVTILGKNWIPMVKDNILYFVVTVDPQLCVLRCDLDDGLCTWETPYELIRGGLQITISRGGTSLIPGRHGDSYIGLGHRTYDCHNHSAFLYMVSKDFSKTFIGPDIPTAKKGISDPLSIYEKDDKIYCCIAHAPRQLGDTLEAVSSLYEIEICV